MASESEVLAAARAVEKAQAALAAAAKREDDAHTEYGRAQQATANARGALNEASRAFLDLLKDGIDTPAPATSAPAPPEPAPQPRPAKGKAR